MKEAPAGGMGRRWAPFLRLPQALAFNVNRRAYRRPRRCLSSRPSRPPDLGVSRTRRGGLRGLLVSKGVPNCKVARLLNVARVALGSNHAILPPMTPKQRPDDYPVSEATRRRDQALAQALSMRPIPHAESSQKPKKKAAPKRRPGSSKKLRK